MAPKKKGKAKGARLTLKAAKRQLVVTSEGKLHLNLSHMGLITFPKCILQMKDIEELDLSRNGLEMLPETVGVFMQLQQLNVHSNQLQRLPNSLGKLRKLIGINASNNKLTVNGLPEEIRDLKSLRSLNLGMNALEIVPRLFASLTKLEELSLFDNQLRKLPESVAALPNLKRLNMKGNPLDVTDENEQEESTVEKYYFVVHHSELCEECLEHFLISKAHHKQLLRLGQDEEAQLNGVTSEPTTQSGSSIEAMPQSEWRDDDLQEHQDETLVRVDDLQEHQDETLVS
uniref:leucine-rich repeat-containing protein 18-like n=1 Tax=Myxine glutinosa TaxID=7769 RepID=UPI00358E2E38